MKKIIISTLVLSLIILGIGVLDVSAHGNQGGAGQGYKFDDSQRPYFQQNEVNLDLEEEQLEEIADFRDEFFDKREDLVEELQDKRYELREAIITDESEDEISKLESEVSDLQNQVTTARTEYLKNMRSVLTEEQINMIIENEARIGMRSGFGFRSQVPTFNRMPRSGNRFHQFQGRTFRSFRGMGGNFRTPARGYCY